MKLTLDKSPRTVLAVCQCGWRGLALTSTQALRRAAQHETEHHPDHNNVRDRYRKQLASTDQSTAR